MKRDWCTLWPDGTWGGCCRRHDIDYQTRRVSRREADRRLRDCVRRRGHSIMAQVMYLGVRAFGWWWWRRAKPMRGPIRMAKAIQWRARHRWDRLV